ncbi:MAG: hypothetical protein AAFV45_00050 [Pseudomonadota bacterium]
MSEQVDKIERSRGSCQLFWDAPKWQGRATLAIGGFVCDTEHAGAELLDEACARANARGIKAVIGPMDGDTWHSYRLVTESDGTPTFPLEPTSGVHDLAAFEAGGFEPISQYISARAPIADTIGAQAPPVDGLTIEPWDGRDADRLIEQLFQMSAAAFARNPFFKPISRADFVALYRPVIPLIDPSLVLFARDDSGTIAGFLFAFKDQTSDERRVIIKTYASRVRGCGRWLLDTAHRRAAADGCSEAIHALMHADNSSLDRSTRSGGRVFRRYALMGRWLEAPEKAGS